MVSEMETLQGSPTGRFAWPKGITRSKYSGMIGNGVTAGVIGRVALQVLKTVGKLPSEYPDYWGIRNGPFQIVGSCSKQMLYNQFMICTSHCFVHVYMLDLTRLE